METLINARFSHLTLTSWHTLFYMLRHYDEIGLLHPQTVDDLTVQFNGSERMEHPVTPLQFITMGNTRNPMWM